MGLDMYLEGKRRFWGHAEMEEGYPLKSKVYELGYWRKHPNLHGYIVQTFAGGIDECQRIELDRTQLGQLLLAVSTKDALPHTVGFFFGASDNTREEREADAAIIRKAISWLETDDKGSVRSIYYQASW